MTKRHSPRSPRSSHHAEPRPRSENRLANPSHLAMPRRLRARRAPSAATVRAQHESQCTICSHPDRAAIDNEFMHWHAIGQIAYDYKLSRSAIYRHAYAMRLFARRNHELRFSLGHLIERVQDVEPTAAAIVRAVYLFARINDEGQSIQPSARVIVSSGAEAASTPSPSTKHATHHQVLPANSRRAVSISLDSSTFAGALHIPSHPPAQPHPNEPQASVNSPAPPADCGAKGRDAQSALQPCNSLKSLGGA